MSFWKDQYGMKPFPVMLIVITAVLTLSTFLYLALEPKCTSQFEGVIRYPGSDGGFRYMCHGGKWEPVRE